MIIYLLDVIQPCFSSNYTNYARQTNVEKYSVASRNQFRQFILIGLCLSLSSCILPDTASALKRTDRGHCPGAVAYEGQPLHQSPQMSWPVKDSVGDDKAVNSTVRARLNAAFANAKANTEAAAMTASISGPQGHWSRTIGSADKVAPFYWASVGKTLTAIVILQMVEEGKLMLETPINRFIDGVPNGNIVTIEHLVAHTSGLPSMSEDPEANTQASKLKLTDEVSWLRQRGALFCPGQFWRYSNSGYALLGAVIEEIDGMSYAQAVTSRLIAPLGKTRMRIVARSSDSDFVNLPTNFPKQSFHPSQAGAAGSVVASADDMIRLWDTLLSDKYLSTQTTRDMFAKLYPMFDQGTYYGQGVMLYDFEQKDGSREIWLGHSGGVPGAKAAVVYSPAHKAFAAIALTGEGSAEATINALLKAL